jgi:hypothetical protein
MKLKLPRYRWLLLIACVVAIIGAVGWWQLSGPRGRITREQFDRIRLGMTPAEVALVIGCSPCGESWDSEKLAEVADAEFERGEAWSDEAVYILVGYGHGKVVYKTMGIGGVPPWKIKARAWLDWLRGLVGW